MRLKTIHANDMQEAMDAVRTQFGEEAVIISTSRNPMGKGVSITVAEEDEDDGDGPLPLGDRPPLEEEEDLMDEPADTPREPRAPYAAIPDYFIRDIERGLQDNGTSREATEALLAEIRHMPKPKDDSAESIRQVLAGALAKTFIFDTIDYTAPGLRLMLIGPPGAGKTLTAAKICARIVKAGHKVQVITTDYKRAGGVEQLASITDILNIELHIVENRNELKAILADIDKNDRIVIDSAGANPYDFHDLKDLAEFAGLLEIEPVLVYPAGGDPVEASEISQAFSFLGVEKLLVTRTDVAKRYGSLLTAAYGGGLNFCHTTGTEKVLGEFNDMTPDVLADLILSYRKE